MRSSRLGTMAAVLAMSGLGLAMSAPASIRVKDDYEGDPDLIPLMAEEVAYSYKHQKTQRYREAYGMKTGPQTSTAAPIIEQGPHTRQYARKLARIGQAAAKMPKHAKNPYQKGSPEHEAWADGRSVG